MTKRSTISCQASVTKAERPQAITSTVRSRAYMVSRPIRSVMAPNTVAPKKMPSSEAAPISPVSTEVAAMSWPKPISAIPIRLRM